MTSRLEQAEAALAAVWSRNEPVIWGRLAILDQAAAALRNGLLQPALRLQAAGEAHKLAGSLGTFRFAEGSRAGAAIEALLEGSRPLLEPQTAQLMAHIAAIRTDLARGYHADAAGRSGAEAGTKSRARLLIVDEDVEFADALLEEAAGRGMHGAVASSLPAVVEAMTGAAPDVILVDPALFGSAEDALVLLRNGSSERRTPLLMMAAAGQLVDRVRAMRGGAAGFLPKPIVPAHAIDAVELALSRTPTPTVLIVDDDPLLLESMRIFLTREGFKVRTQSNALRFWESLEGCTPDIVVLDIEMPGVNGLDLCRTVRNDARWGTIPIVFLTASQDRQTILEVYSAGADDFVRKPPIPLELVSRLRNRLERVRLQRRLAETDIMTGVASRSHGSHLLADMMRRAEATGGTVALGVIDVDHLRLINDRNGHESGDEVLRHVGEALTKAFGPNVSRWGGGEFVVGVMGADRHHGVKLLQDALESFSKQEFKNFEGGKFMASFSGGVVQFPDDGKDLTTLFRAADRTLSQAKNAGRDRILAAVWTANQTRRSRKVDVVVVEDDDVLADYISSELQAIGYRTARLADGQEAIGALSGASPRLRGKVILLDVGLPRLDGMSVLRRLAREGLLNGTQVIMMTARTSREAVQQAADIGACDFVAKPLLMSVLVDHIKRAFDK